MKKYTIKIDVDVDTNETLVTGGVSPWMDLAILGEAIGTLLDAGAKEKGMTKRQALDSMHEYLEKVGNDYKNTEVVTANS